MADNLSVTAGTGSTIGMDEVTLNAVAVKVGYGKILDGTADGTNPLVVNASGEAKVINTAGNASLSSIDGKITAVNTGAVVVSSSALPTDAATSAKQDTGNTSVASIDTKTPALGQALAAASVPVILPSATITTLTPPAAITNFANETGGNLASVKTNTDKIPAQGQALAAASMPVVLTAAQITTLTPPAAITGYSTAAAQTDKSQFTKITDGTDTALVTAAGEQNVIATAQPGVDIGDVTINNAAGGSAVNIQDGGNSITVDGAVTTSGTVTEANSAAILTSVDGLETSNSAIQTAVQLIDDTVTTLGTDTYTEATSKGLTLGAVRRDADTTLVNTTNEFTPLQVDANGRLKVEAFSGETLPVSLASTTVTGTVAVTQSGTWDEVGINDSGNSITVDAPVGTPAFVRLSDGAAAITTLPVSLASVPSHAVTNAGTFLVQNNATSSSAATTSVANSVTSVTLLASNASRKSASIFNDDTAASLYVKLGATASATSYKIKIAPGGYFELPSPVYTGVVDGIATAATGSARISEET